MADDRPIRIGTRGSKLALAQAHEVRDRLVAAHGMRESDFEIEVISTSGDRIQDRPLSEAGGKGLFTKELEAALLDGRIDLAAHSSKDVATIVPDGLTLSAFLPREDVRDAFIGRTAPSLAELPEGALVGSASLRRQALIRRMRPDLQVEIIRGNVQTRLRKLEEGRFDGTLLALAGLNRMAMQHVATDVMTPDAFPPAPGQGAICIESRLGDERIDRLVLGIDHAATSTALHAERAFLAELDGSCRTPIAALAAPQPDGTLLCHGMSRTPDGSQMHQIRLTGLGSDAAEVGRIAGAKLLEEAGPGFFEGWGG